MFNKIIAGYCFIVTLIFTVTGIFSAEEFPQILFSLMFLPVAFYFWRLMVVKNAYQKLQTTNLAPYAPTYPQSPGNQLNPNNPVRVDDHPIEGEQLSEDQVKDINKRLFLKLIGGAGFTTFLFALFTKSSQAAFFGSVPGPGTVAIKDSSGNPIDPAEKQPTDGYEVSQVDDTSIPAYYGFVDKDGNWYIAKEGAGGEYRYYAGSSDFATNWTNRSGLQYDYFNNIF